MSKRIAIFGWPLTYSKSPNFQNAGLKKLGIDAIYEAIPADEGSFQREFLAFFSDPDSIGANITNPYKVEVRKYVDKVTEEALHIGAINTIFRKENKLWGHNTDAVGFKQAFLHEFKNFVADERILVLGAGGTARAVLWGIPRDVCKGITIAARKLEAAEELCRLHDEMKNIVAKRLDLEDLSFTRLYNGHDVIINTVSDPNFSRLLGKYFSRDLENGPKKKVMDLNYAEGRDGIFRAALQSRHAAANGLRMLLEQGCASFEIWTGQKAPKKEMAEALGLGID